MSKQKNMRTRNYRCHLLATVSAMTLFTVGSTGQVWAGDDVDKPAIWLDIGAQLEALGGGREKFVPPFVAADLNAPYNVKSPLGVETSSRFSFGENATITFQPENSDWSFSAGIRFGRSNGGKHRHQQTSTRARYFAFYFGSTIVTRYGLQRGYSTETRFSDSQSAYSEKHTILDFSAGKDVGLGLFGHGGEATVSLGVRIAQFRDSMNMTFRSLPDNYYYPVFKYMSKGHHHSYYANGTFTRSFRGVGPSLSWKGSAPIAGDPQNGELAIDWGINAALLFGKQKVRGHHEITGRYIKGNRNIAMYLVSQYDTTLPIDRTKIVTVPNLGGSVGLSFQFVDAKISIGYRADVFFGAMDGGIDTSKSESRSFYGPFATISVGMGD